MYNNDDDADDDKIKIENGNARGATTKLFSNYKKRRK